MAAWRIVLFGYGEMGCTALEFLLSKKEQVVGVITHRDDPKEKHWYRSLAQVAKANALDVFYSEDVPSGTFEELMRRLRPDLALSFYYRQMLPMQVLRIAAQGALNLHGSLLPRLRGRAPTNWALVECEERIGVTLHHMVKAPDAGDIVAQRGWAIGPKDTAKTIFDRQVEETKILLHDVWPKIRDGTAPRIPQDHSKATYRGRRRPEDGHIDWSLPTKRIDGLVRAVTDPFPGAYTFFANRKLMIWAGSPAPGRGAPGHVIDEMLVATGDGAYRIERCEFEDDKEAPAILKGGSILGA